MDPVDRVRIRTCEDHSESDREDTLAVEEPLEIRIRATEGSPASSFVTTMRTPGADEELAAGLLFAEGVVERREELLALDRPTDPRIDPEIRANVLVATLAPDAAERAGSLRRATVMGSACGVCGKTSIENVLPSDRPPLSSALKVSPELLYALPERLRESQSIFARTEAFTQRPSSRRPASSRISGKTSDGTTPRTKSSGRPCCAGACRSRTEC